MRQYMHQQLLHAPLGPKSSSSAGQRSGVSGRTFSFDFIFVLGYSRIPLGKREENGSRFARPPTLATMKPSRGWGTRHQPMMGRSVEKKYSHRLGSVNLSSSGFITSRYDFELPNALNPSISSNQSSTRPSVSPSVGPSGLSPVMKHWM